MPKYLTRIFKLPPHTHVFIFGPRGVGKTYWLRETFPYAPFLDLLDAEVFYTLSRNPAFLFHMLPAHYSGPVIIDEVHRQIEMLNSKKTKEKIYFILTGSSARKLKSQGVNLLAGRAHVFHFYPLTAFELKHDFDLKKALRHGMLPACWSKPHAERYLKSYITTYLEQEITRQPPYSGHI